MNDSVVIAEQYLDEMLEAEANSDYAAYVQRFEKRDVEDFGESTFRKEMFAIHEELAQYRSREYLGSMKGQVDADRPDRYPDRVRHVWRGRFEKNDVIIAISLHERNGTFHVSENMYYGTNITPKHFQETIMLDQARSRTATFQQRLRDSGIGIAVLTDESSIAYLAGFWGYLSVEFGRPAFLIVRPDEPPVVLTPRMESEMVSAMTWIDSVMTYEDTGADRWQNVLATAIGARPARVAVESGTLPAIVRVWFDATLPGATLEDVSPVLGAMRMIKSTEEITVMRQAGEIAAAMMVAAEGALAEGVPEYEVALAVIDAGSRKSAGFLTDRGWDAFISPMIHGLQIMQSGRDTSMVHRRASVKRLETGDPVYFCFCNMAQFKLYRLGFDRMFFIRQASDEAIRVQQAAIDAQQAAIAAIRPGVSAESVAEAANVVYRERGYETGYRTGRSIGMSYLEAPELKTGDRTILRSGMTFAVDGGISLDGSLGGRIGDSIVVTDEGCEYLTDYSRDIIVVDR